MNFLAHIHLSGDDPGWMLGGILGDFARGLLTPDRFPAPIQMGIVLHRKIDGFTDSHPVWLASKSLLSKDQRRFAGIVIDVFYDHFLAKNWRRYSNQPLDRWAENSCLTLQSEIANLVSIPSDPSAHLPEASEMIDAMAEYDWLTSYRDPGEIPNILARISQRSHRLVTMTDSAEVFDRHYSDFESHFLTFYPEVTDMAKSFRRKNDQSPTS